MGFLYDRFLCEVDKKLYSDVVRVVQDSKHDSIDELGSGSGQLTRRLPTTSKIRALDFSEKAIEKAKKLAGENVEFIQTDFYKEIPNTYDSDITIACRSLYHPDLNVSLDMLAEHTGQGLAIVAHPKPSLWDYALPQINGSRQLNLIQLIKGMSGRISNRIGHSYNLFDAEEFEKIGKQSFNQVHVENCAYGTHNLVLLQQ